MGGREESGWEEERKWVSEVSLIPLLISLPMKKSLVTRAWLQEPGYKSLVTKLGNREGKQAKQKQRNIDYM